MLLIESADGQDFAASLALINIKKRMECSHYENLQRHLNHTRPYRHLLGRCFICGSSGMNVHTWFDPDRGWMACREEEKDNGPDISYIGVGRTEREACEDLYFNIDEE